MSDRHDRIIASAAKVELASLGFRQKGRSRLWFADRGLWLNVVEFTPDRWSKGVSLMNAAHWLWVDAGFMSFNEAISSSRHAAFEIEDRFRSEVRVIAGLARSNAAELERRFSSFNAIADFVVERARSSPDGMALSWWGLEAGIASGLVGDFRAAQRFLSQISDERLKEHVARLLPLADDPAMFKSRVKEMVEQERARLKLPLLAGEVF